MSPTNPFCCSQGDLAEQGNTGSITNSPPVPGIVLSRPVRGLGQPSVTPGVDNLENHSPCCSEGGIGSGVLWARKAEPVY